MKLKRKRAAKRPEITSVQFPYDLVQKAKVLCVPHGVTNGEYIVAKVTPIIEREFKQHQKATSL